MFVRLAPAWKARLLAPVLASLCGSPVAVAQNRDDSNAVGFSGQATVVRAAVAVTAILADTGPLPASGGALEAFLFTAKVPGVLTAEMLRASTVGRGDQSRSEASLATLDLAVGGNSIAAAFLMARALASCGLGVSGGSDIARLTVNGQATAVTGSPNQIINLPNGRIIINEQSSNPGAITVNALHVVVSGSGDVVISSAHAGVVCKPGTTS